MICSSFTLRSRTVLNHLLQKNVFNKPIRNLSTSHNCLAGVKKRKDSSTLTSDKFSVPPRDVSDEGEQFRYMLRNSSFINMGDPENKIVKGKIFHSVKDDLYIDFGWKFYCVCPRPSKNGHLYARGSTVLLKIKSLEMSTKFLGTEKDLTLLEADASIVRLIYSPVKSD
ncbi:small ribosomal subunit protein bS1m [Planococcus citri]|uniref:small ribosomal subunit protein bS1m n=1 Tax=Planococcus citri TaxID=170843 RepID=UPI0031FA1C08